MQGISATIPRSLPVGAQLTVADNTGVRIFEIFTVKGYRGVRRRVPSAGIGDYVIGSAKKGKQELMHQVLLYLSDMNHSVLQPANFALHDHPQLYII